MQQIDAKMQAFLQLSKIVPPPTGWVKAIRTSLGMSLLQLGNKLKISKQSALDLEKREIEETITLKALREAAHAMDMQLVYGLIPRDGNLNAMVERKAKILAQQIVSRTSNNMKLEDQENSKERLEKAVLERTTIIKNEMPKALWD